MTTQRLIAPALLWLAAAAVLAAAGTPPVALLVGNKDESTLAIVDPASGKVVGRVPTGQDPHEVAVSADGSVIDVIARYDPDANQIDWLITPDETPVWTAHSRDGGVSVIDAAGRKVIATLEVKTKRSNRLKFTPDGRRVLITDLDGGELVVLDAASRQEIKRLKLGKTPEGVTGHLSTGKGPDGMAWAVRP